MTAAEFIETQPAERRALMITLHDTIIANDPSVTPVIKPMMGKEMILYEERCYMKYGLAGVKNHLSLHCLPIYMNPALHIKYEPLLPDARFQKGCINFTDAAAMPVNVVAQLVKDCATINIADLLENRKKKK